MYTLKKYLIALFLLFTFVQGISMRLWMHHWFHDGPRNGWAASADEVKIKCDCVQDANLPFQEAHQFEVAAAFPELLIRHLSCNVSCSSTDKMFCSLKGPPAAPVF